AASEAAAVIPAAALVAAFAAFVAIGYEVGNVIDGLTNGGGFDKLGGDLDAADKAVKQVFADASTFTPQKLVDATTQLVRGNTEFSKALVDARSNTSEFVLELTAGGDAWQQYIDRASHAKGVT